MGDIYFPSCNFNKATPETAKLLLERMKAIMPVAGCCRVDKLEYPKGDRALYLCQACREVIEVRFPGLVPENLFVWLASLLAYRTAGGTGSTRRYMRRCGACSKRWA